MSEDFTTVEYTGWFGRIKDAIVGVLFGAVMILVAPILLFWNESRAIDTAKGLAEGKGAVVDAKAKPVDAANEKKLVHVSGKATPAEPVKDGDLGVVAPAIRLKRTVEIYQWKEQKETREEKRLGGGTEKITHYKYVKEWSEGLHESAKFKESSGHENPTEMPYKSAVADASKVTLGAFTLASSQVSQIQEFKAMPATDEMKSQLPGELQEKVKLSGGSFYVGANPGTPAVGDMRLSYQLVPPQDVSVIARQEGSSFSPYQTKTGTTIELVRAGNVSAAEMFQAAESENAMMTWLIRAGGFLLFWIGLALIGGPLVAVADVIPFFGSILGAGIGFFSFLMAAALTLLTVGIAWITVRPVLGGALLGGVLALLIIGKSVGRPSKG